MKNFKKNKILVISVTCLLLVVMLTNVVFAYTYTVVNGDSIFKISQKTGVPVSIIKSANGIWNDKITVGQKLSVPVRYTVESRDTIFKIAQKFGVTIAEIKNANGLKSDIIKPGYKLWIPDSYVESPQNQNRNYSVPSRGGVSSRDLMILAQLINAEAGGESYIGKIAVGAVVINRMKSGQFANTIPGVIYQIDKDGYFQFSPVLDGRIGITPSNESIKAAREALEGKDPTNGALYFYNPQKTPNQWLRNKTVSTVIGDHVFTY